MTRARGQRGFTLLELIIALAIVGALLAIAFGGLRVAVGSWRRGDERVEIQQHTRSLTLALARAISAAYPYLGTAQAGESSTILFTGAKNRLQFVTQASPFPAAMPIAFMAVVIELGSTRDEPRLVIRQRVLPNDDPFTDATTVLEDETIKTIELAYLGDAGWETDWDARSRGVLPRAIRIAVGTKAGADHPPLAALTVAIGAPRR